MRDFFRDLGAEHEFCVTKRYTDSNESCADDNAPRFKIEKNAASDSNVVDANFAQVHRRTRNFSPIERTSDAASSFGPVF